MVVGAGVTKLTALQEICARSHVHLLSGLSEVDMARQLSKSSLILATAGMIVYEAIAVGVPLLAYPQLPEMKLEVNWFATRGACLNVDSIAWDPDLLYQTICITLADAIAAHRMSSCQRQLLDGLGMDRAAALIDELLAKENIPHAYDLNGNQA